MAVRRSLVAAYAASVLPWATAGAAVREVDRWKINNVAVLTTGKDLPGAEGPLIIGTTFAPFGHDQVFAVTDLKAGAAAKVVTITEAMAWPNEAAVVPACAAKGLQGSHLSVADGFLFPGKRTGGVHLINVTAGLGAASWRKVSQDKSAWFYHHVDWMDIDGDDLLDIVSARAMKPLIFGEPGGEFVWIKNLGNGSFGDTQVLFEGPGVNFQLVDLDGDGSSEIVASEFFKAHRLAIYSCAQKPWTACAGANSVEMTIVDSSEGPFFNVQWVDLNGDGKKELLATSQQLKDISGKVLAYEQPHDWRTGNWTAHILADGYTPQPKQPAGSGSPGTAAAFIMDAHAGGKPHIIVSGDDGGVVDLLAPASQDATNWTYERSTLYSTEKATVQGVRTIGTPVVLDVDGSGRPELFIPSYAEGELIMLTLDALSAPGVATKSLRMSTGTITV